MPPLNVQTHWIRVVARGVGCASKLHFSKAETGEICENYGRMRIVVEEEASVKQ